MAETGDLSAEAIRNVQFREKVRGYHPGDVDAFVASVAATVERLERQARETASRLAELETRASGAAEAEDSLRRTLVMAQRTADMAMQEAREEAARVTAEAAAERERARTEVEDLRTRLTHEVQEEARIERERWSEERATLLADVAALEAHLQRERERLHIYFSDQLRRVEGGEPGLAEAPAMRYEGAATATNPPPPPADDSPPGERAAAAGVPASGDGTDGDGVDAGPAASAQDDDPFLAELRRAVTDDQPLGPRDEDPDAPNSGEESDPFELFGTGDDDPGRFGSRLRRRR